MLSAVTVSVAGAVCAVWPGPPNRTVFISILFSASCLAAPEVSGLTPDIVMLPACPDRLTLSIKTWGTPVMSVPSGMILARSVFTLSEIFPAGAPRSLNAVVKIPVSLLTLNVSVVMVILPAGVLGVPPSDPVLRNVLLRATSLAASLGRMPEILMLPVGPAVSPGLLLVTINTFWDPAIGVSSGFTLLRRVLTWNTISPAGAGPIVFATRVAASVPPPGNPALVRTTESAVMVIDEGAV